MESFSVLPDEGGLFCTPPDEGGLESFSVLPDEGGLESFSVLPDEGSLESFFVLPDERETQDEVTYLTRQGFTGLVNCMVWSLCYFFLAFSIG